MDKPDQVINYVSTTGGFAKLFHWLGGLFVVSLQWPYAIIGGLIGLWVSYCYCNDRDFVVTDERQN